MNAGINQPCLFFFPRWLVPRSKVYHFNPETFFSSKLGRRTTLEFCCSTQAKKRWRYVGFNIARSKNKRRTTTSATATVVLPQQKTRKMG
jgi:hypothetical protein